MRLEYRLSQRFCAAHDFREGVRAVVIDKDNAPRWRPDRLDAVTHAEIDAYFAPLPQGDLELSPIC
jgi:enoyl-CoA hydratase